MQYYIIDFDSTFVSVEALDELAKKALADLPDKTERQRRIDEIESITRQGMEGTIGFGDSLARRLEAFKPHQSHIDALIRQLKRSITPSFKRNKAFFKQHANEIYIISGGFAEYIVPVVASFGIEEDHVLANRFVFDDGGMVTGFDPTVALAHDQGKAKALEQLELPGKIVVLGDGSTDAQIKKAGAADTFYAFTEHVRRDQVVIQADAEVPNFDEFLYRMRIPASVSYPKNRIKVLLVENIHADAAHELRHEGYEVEEVPHALTEAELIQKISDVSVLGIRSKTKVTAQVLHHAHKLLSIGAFCIGTNQIDLQAATAKGVMVQNAPYSNTRSVVELTIGAIISLSRRMHQQNADLHRGLWNKSAFGAHEIRGKKLGIIGYGNIGSQLSVLAESLGMQVIFFDIVDKLALGNAQSYSSMEQVLREADIVSIHVDGRPENTHLIDLAQFALMKPSAHLINYSRGSVVAMEALVQALRNNQIAGAAIDVFPSEPASNKEPFTSPLRDYPQALLTPHVGGSTQEAQVTIAQFVSNRLITFINAGDTSMSVNLPAIQLPPMERHARFIHIHDNHPGVLAQINAILSEEGINIEGQYLKTNDRIGYVVVDTNRAHSKSVREKLEAIPGTIRVRVLY